MNKKSKSRTHTQCAAGAVEKNEKGTKNETKKKFNARKTPQKSIGPARCSVGVFRLERPVRKMATESKTSITPSPIRWNTEKHSKNKQKPVATGITLVKTW